MALWRDLPSSARQGLGPVACPKGQLYFFFSSCPFLLWSFLLILLVKEHVGESCTCACTCLGPAMDLITHSSKNLHQQHTSVPLHHDAIALQGVELSLPSTIVMWNILGSPQFEKERRRGCWGLTLNGLAGCGKC